MESYFAIFLPNLLSFHPQHYSHSPSTRRWSLRGITASEMVCSSSLHWISFLRILGEEKGDGRTGNEKVIFLFILVLRRSRIQHRHFKIEPYSHIQVILFHVLTVFLEKNWLHVF